MENKAEYWTQTFNILQLHNWDDNTGNRLHEYVAEKQIISDHLLLCGSKAEQQNESSETGKADGNGTSL